MAEAEKQLNVRVKRSSGLDCTLGGNISLASSNPFDSPLINPNYLSTDFDIFTIRESMKAARTFMAAPAWDDCILGGVGTFAQAKTDDEIEQNVRNTSRYRRAS